MAFEYITVKQAAEKWNVSMRRVQQLCELNRLDGIIRPGREWLIPENAIKPEDGRINNRRQPKKGNTEE
jgi:excisionase family DNA binding protein